MCLARRLSNGDKILSENYLQHADPFTRVLSERDSFRREKLQEIKGGSDDTLTNELQDPVENVSKSNLIKMQMKIKLKKHLKFNI